MGRRAMTSTRCDVLVAGGGLVGLSLASALARTGLSVALVDRAPVDTVPADPATIDSRVYAISPGSVAFLAAQRAWAALPADRMQPVESMRVEGDRGAVLEFSAHDVGVRALAWIVEEREIRAALVPRVRDEGVVVLAPRRFAVARIRAGLRLADPGGRRSGRGAAGRRCRRRALVGARGRRDARSPPTLRADRGRGQLRLRAPAPRLRAAVVPRGRRHSRLAAVAGTPRVDRLVGTRGTRHRVDVARSRRARLARRRGRRAARSATSKSSRRRPHSRCSSCACPRSSPIASRWQEMPRTACIRWPGRA